MNPILDQGAQGSGSSKKSSVVNVAVLVPVLLMPFIVVVATTHDQRVIFISMAVYFGAFAVVAHLKSVVVRVALAAGAQGAAAAAWFYDFGRS